MTLWPRSLAGRTALLLLIGLLIVQAAGLTIHALDRVELQSIIQSREIAGRGFALWRNMVVMPPERRAAFLADLEMPAGMTASFDAQTAVRAGMPPVNEHVAHRFRLNGPPPSFGPARFRPREILVAGIPPDGFVLSMRFIDGGWLNLRVQPPHARPWHSDTFLAADRPNAAPGQHALAGLGLDEPPVVGLRLHDAAGRELRRRRRRDEGDLRGDARGQEPGRDGAGDRAQGRQGADDGLRALDRRGREGGGLLNGERATGRPLRRRLALLELRLLCPGDVLPELLTRGPHGLDLAL
ncbi:MAG: hypothetical protein EBX37_06420, partial [Alphaproteobacteria bacterium]|nr:hypothetical protein [Alphaproteobacteria bacterium]